MKSLKTPYLIITATVAVALFAYAAYLMAWLYPDVLITAQDRNTFTSDALFFSENMHRPFGLMQYVGAFLTQFFFRPAIGTAILIALWSASVVAGIKAFRLKGIWRALMIVPAACFLSSQLDLGYWVYCLPIPGYWFSQSVAYLCLMLMLWAATATPRRLRIAWYAVAGFALFPVMGWTSYLFAICFVISQLARGRDIRKALSWMDLAGILLAAVAPLVFRALIYKDMQMGDIINAGFPFFENATDVSLRPTLPFFIIIGTTVLAAFGRVLPEWKRVPACAAYLVVGLASAATVWTTIFDDENYLYEIQMTQATAAEDWQKVVSVAEKTKTPSRTMVMLKNIALLNTGELGTRSYELGNDGKEIYNPDSLNLNIMHIASPLILYNHGAVNYAYRWCVEFAIPYGFSPYYLRTLARCAEASGEKALAQRYTRRLNSTLYYSHWQPAPASPIVKELMDVSTDTLVNDDNSCERYLIMRFCKEHHSNSRYFAELNMLYSSIMRNANNFLVSLYNYMRINNISKLPTAYEEAYITFKDQSDYVFTGNVEVDPENIERYKAFFGDGSGYAKYMDEDGTREAMRERWGTSYWWFNAFGRQAY